MLNMNEPVKKVADLSIRCNILMRRKNQEENKREMCSYFFFFGAMPVYQKHGKVKFCQVFLFK